MAATEPSKVADGELPQQDASSEGPAGTDPPGPGPLAELGRLLEEARTLGGRLFADACVLAHAQWRLSRHVLIASAGLLALRALAMMVFAALLMASWVMLNVALWQATSDLTRLGFAPPLGLVVLNLVAALVVYRWQEGLRVR